MKTMKVTESNVEEPVEFWMQIPGSPEEARIMIPAKNRKDARKKFSRLMKGIRQVKRLVY